ncbi:MAG: hypothetical protein D6832_02885 [Alphaproteobacteria bacterium]|nr:MAG: hypothetical protein D6832_02885 [Alphaproteobacteria bacterium]
MSGRVERMQATWGYASYAACDPPHRIADLNLLIDAFAHRPVTHRPHDALGQKPPRTYLCRHDSADPLTPARTSHMS